MDLSPAKRFRRRGCVKQVQRKVRVKKQRTRQNAVEMIAGGGNSQPGLRFLKSIGSTNLVGGMFGNGRSSDCCVRSSQGEELIARRRGDLQLLLSLHSKKNAMSVLEEGRCRDLLHHESPTPGRHCQDLDMVAKDNHVDCRASNVVSIIDQTLPLDFQPTDSPCLEKDSSFPVIHPPTQSQKESSLSISSPDLTTLFPIPQVSAQTGFLFNHTMKNSPISSIFGSPGTQISEQSFLENMLRYWGAGACSFKSRIIF